MCLLHFGLEMSDFLMGLLHFLFLFFLGCPDGTQERFSVIWAVLWEPLGGSLEFLGFLERTGSALWSPLGTILVTMLISWGVLWRSCVCLVMSLVTTLTVWMSKPRKTQLF